MTDREDAIRHDLKRAKRARRMLIGAAAAVCLVALIGLAGAVIANVVNISQGRDITKIQRSPCTADPDGGACQRVKRVSDEHRSVSSTCVLFEKVDEEGKLLRLTRCGKPVASPQGGDASQSPTSAAQQPTPATSPAQGGVHSTPAPHNGGGDQGLAPDGSTHSPAGEPTAAAAAPSESTSNSATSTTTTESTVTMVEEPARPVREAAGGLVEEVGEAVGGASESVNGVLCTLTASC